jgi:uncharacterized protein DUF927
VSPFLEVIRAPSVVVHLAGPTGIGKTTVLRLAISAFADPFSSATGIDFAKDTKNYADAHLGILHNFPILLDETTLSGPEAMAEVAYNVTVGRTRGRLGDAERDYGPVKPMSYSLVCLLSGESSIREGMEQRGAAARFVEIPEDEPILPRAHLPRWNDFAKQHYGWLGRDLVADFADPARRERLVTMYQVGRALTSLWCDDHSRTADFLALLQLGHRLAARRLGFDDSHEAAEEFAQLIYTKLNRRTKLDTVLDAIGALPGCPGWIEAGAIPCDALEPLIKEFRFRDRADLRDALKAHGLVSKIEPRKAAGLSRRCFILTDEGRARLAGALAPAERV